MASIFRIHQHHAHPRKTSSIDDRRRSSAHDVIYFCHKTSIAAGIDRKSTRLNSSHGYISYAVFCLKKKKIHSFHLVDTDRRDVSLRPLAHLLARYDSDRSIPAVSHTAVAACYLLSSDRIDRVAASG